MTGLALWVALASGGAGADVLDDAEALVALGPRVAGTDGGHAAQAWVTERLPARLARRVVGSGSGAGAVLACTGEPDGAAWLLAHTDSVHRRCPGAVDNAGAVAVALAVADRVAADPPDHPVCVAFPDGEEPGLLGSQGLAARHRPAWVLALELIGQGELTAMDVGAAWGAPGLRWLTGAGVEVPWAYRVYGRLLPARARSDHGPFAARGVQGFLLLGRGAGGVYWRYHTAEDGPDQLELEALEEAADTVESLLRSGPPEPAPDAAVQVPWTPWVLPGVAVWTLLGAGVLAGAAVGWRGLRGAAVGLGVALAGSLAGGLGWWLALHGRDGGGALAAPGLVVWTLGLVLVLTRLPRRSDGAAGGALLAALAALGLAALDPLLALPWGLAAGGLALAGRWPLALLLALPLPAYLAWPETWRELVFHQVVPGSPWPWALVLAVVWAPLVAGLCSLDWRPRGRWVLGALVVALASGALWPEVTASWPAREVLWAR